MGGWGWGEAFVKIQKKYFFLGGGVRSGGGSRVGGGGGGGVRVDGNREVKLL